MSTQDGKIDGCFEARDVAPLDSATGSALKKRVHVIPVGHPEPLHSAKLTCWCNPLEKTEEIIIHHAKDGREKWERQGIVDPERPWHLIYEDAPNAKAEGL